MAAHIVDETSYERERERECVECRFLIFAATTYLVKKQATIFDLVPTICKLSHCGFLPRKYDKSAFAHIASESKKHIKIAVSRHMVATDCMPI